MHVREQLTASVNRYRAKRICASFRKRPLYRRFEFEGQTYASMMRSPSPCRRRSINIRGAARSRRLRGPDGRYFIADRINPIPNKTFSLHPAEIPLVNSDGTPAFNVPDYPLPADKARFVGEAIAMVIAESIAVAKDGAERVIIDYEPLDCVTFTVDAAGLGSPRVRDENSSNVCIDAQVGEAEPTGAAFPRAAHIAKIKTWIPRVAGSPMEPRAAPANTKPPPGVTR